MSTNTSTDHAALLQGTLDLLILRTLAIGPHHGHGITLAIRHNSGRAILVDHGSLYPALQRLEASGRIRGSWGVSENNRRARFYEITKAGRKRLSAQATSWRRIVDAVGQVLGPELARE